MPKSHSTPSKRAEIAFGSHKAVCITPYQSNVYLHINDKKKNKSVTFTLCDFEEFLENVKEMKIAIAKFKSQIKKSKSVKTKQSKKLRKKEIASSESETDDVNMSGDSDSD